MAIHDLKLVDLLSNLPTEEIDTCVYRVTQLNADPLFASNRGGRWSTNNIAALYTCFEKDGAISEVASYLSQMNPVPRNKIHLHKIDISAKNVIRLDKGILQRIGVDSDMFGTRNYKLTQDVGEIISNLLGIEGLISPSARWDCGNFTLFVNNHDINEKCKTVETDEIEWLEWFKNNKSKILGKL